MVQILRRSRRMIQNAAKFQSMQKNRKIKNKKSMYCHQKIVHIIQFEVRSRTIRRMLFENDF